MTAPDRRPSWILVTLTCTVLGFLTYFVLWPVTFDFQDLDVLPESYVIPRVAFLAWQFPSGVISLACLPFVLRGRNSSRPAQYVVATATVAFGLFSALGFYSGLCAIVELASRRSMRWANLAGVAAVCGSSATLAADPKKSDLLLTFLLGCVIIMVCLFVGVSRGKRREAKAAAWHEEQQAARHDERLLVARDMHDSLAHRLSLIAVHAGALELRQDLDPQTRANEAATIREQAAEAVADLQDVLSVLRTEPEAQDPRLTVHELVSQAKAAGMEVRLDTDSRGARKLATLSTTAQHTVHRTVQECLTNARKHAPNAPVSITINAEQELRVQVSNPGTATAKTPGVGLVGLAERAELSGGKLTVESDPFTVTLELP